MQLSLVELEKSVKSVIIRFIDYYCIWFDVWFAFLFLLIAGFVFCWASYDFLSWFCSRIFLWLSNVKLCLLTSLGGVLVGSASHLGESHTVRAVFTAVRALSVSPPWLSPKKISLKLKSGDSWMVLSYFSSKTTKDIKRPKDSFFFLDSAKEEKRLMRELQ